METSGYATTTRRSSRSTYASRRRRRRRSASPVSTQLSLLSFDVDDRAGRAIVPGFLLHRAWLDGARADALYAAILRRTTWVKERRKMYDRFVDVPREQAWFGDDRERGFTPELAALRADVQAFVGARFVYVLLNRYRDGRDSVAWHSDSEVASLRAPTIASLTLGATRAFDIRAKAERARVHTVDVSHGDLIVMSGQSQSHYEHRVRKDARIRRERINLTFRQQPA